MRLRFYTTITIIGLMGIGLIGCAKNASPPSEQTEVEAQPSWKTKVGTGSAGQSLALTPVVEKGIIYAVSHDGFTTAIDEKTGNYLWSVKLRFNPTSGLAIHDNLLYVGTGNGFVIALNKKDGKIVWTTPITGEVYATPTIAWDTLLVKSEDGKLYALESKSGKELWLYQSLLPDIIIRSGSSAKVANGMVIAGFANGQITALSLSNGQMMWRQSLEYAFQSNILTNLSTNHKSLDIDQDPIIHDGKIYISTIKGQMAALDLRTGEIVWTREFSGFAGMAMGDDQLFVTDQQGVLWAFNPDTGKVDWKQEQLVSHKLTAPQVYKGSVVVGNQQGSLYYFAQKDGRPQNRVQVANSGIIGAPIVSGRSLFVLTQNGNLVKYQ